MIWLSGVNAAEGDFCRHGHLGPTGGPVGVTPFTGEHIALRRPAIKHSIDRRIRNV